MTPQTHTMNICRLLFCAGLAMCGAVQADPVSELASLLGNDEQRPREAPRSWRDYLTAMELEMLEGISRHPAVATCILMADNHHPVAGYQIRKLARFGALVQRRLSSTGALPDLKSLHYQWPARALRWCSAEAGISSAGDTSLLSYANHLARIIHRHHRQPGIVAQVSAH